MCFCIFAEREQINRKGKKVKIHSHQMLNGSLCFPTTPSVACTQLKTDGEESSFALCNETTTTTIISPSSLQGSTEPSGQAQARPEAEPHTLAFPSSASICDLTAGDPRKPRRAGMLRRSWHNMMPCSRSVESMLAKTKATFTGKSDGQHSQSPYPPKVQRVFSVKSLPKSLSQGSAAACGSCGRLSSGASLLLPESTAEKLDTGTRRCPRPISRCFLWRKKTTDGDDYKSTQLLFSANLSGKENTGKAGCKAEQTVAAVSGMTLKARLARVNSMKGKTYSLRTGFALAREDALAMISLLRPSAGPSSRGEKPEVSEADAETFSQLLLMQAKVLSGACSQMAAEYDSPEELLLTLTHSFHTLCCLTQACMSLVEGLDAETERRELVVKVEEVVMNYFHLLKAAEVAVISSPSDQSVNALTHHSATMSAIINSLTQTLTTPLDK